MKTSNTPLTGTSFPICSIPSEKLNSLTPSDLSLGSTPDTGYPNKKLKNFSNSFSTTMKNLIGQSLVVKAILFSLFFTISFVSLGQVSVTPIADLVTADDTGSNTTDDLTYKTSVSIDVTFASPETSTVLTLNVDGMFVASQMANSPTTMITFGGVALNAGSNSITIDSKEVGKATSTGSLTITVDNVPPTNPTIALEDTPENDSGSDSNDNITNVINPQIKGNAEAGASNISVSLNGTPLGAVSSDGTYSYTVGTDLSSGPNTITVEVEDAAGNTSTNSLGVIYDGDAPSAPVVTAIVEDTGSSSSDGITSDTNINVTGTSSEDISIELFLDGSSVGAVTAASGWTLNGVAVAQGTHTLTAQATDVAGNTSTISSDFDITIDTAAPATVAINDVTLDESGADVEVDLAAAFNDVFDTDAQLTYNITDGGANSSTTSLAFGVFVASVTANTLTLNPDAVGLNTPAGEDVTIEATDRAGNTASQTFNVKVQQVDIVFSLSIDDGAGGNVKNRSVDEIAGSSATENFTFMVSADVAVNTTTVVNYSITEVITELAANNDGNVNQTDDGNAALNGSGTITFEPGDTEKIVIYQVEGDNVVEGFEDIVMTLNSASNAGSGSLTVDALPSTLTIEDTDLAEIQFRQSEGGPLATTYTVNEAAGTLDFTLRLSRRIDRALKVNFGTFEIAANGASAGNDEAVQGTDYTALVNNLTWTAGTSGASEDVEFSIPLTDDLLVELDEEFNITLVNILDATNGDIAFPSDGYNIRFDNAGGGDGAALCTINNDDTAVIKVNADQDITEGDTGTIDATFVASLSGTVDRDLSVSWIAQNGIGVDNQATSDDSQPTKPWLDDYIPDTGTVTFLANDAAAQDTETVAVKGDNIIEQDETFRFSLVAVPTTYATNANGNPITFEGEVVQLSSTATIENDDFGLLNVSTTADSNEGNAVKTFTVALVGTDGNTKTVDVDINVDYEISTGTRTVNMETSGDFFEDDGSLTITANNTQTTFDVDIYQDDVVEIDETFTATLTNLDVSDLAGANTRTAVTLDEETSVNTLTKAYTYTILNEDFVKVQIFADAGATQDSKTVTETNADFGTVLSVKIVEQASGMATKTIDNDLLIDLGEFTGNTIQAATGTDYTFPDVVVIQSGDMVQSFTVTVKGDEVVERDEDLTITIPTSSISVVDDGMAGTPTTYASYTGDNDVVIDLAQDEATVTIDNEDVTVLSITTVNQISSAEANTLTFQVVSSLEVDADYDIEFTVEIPTRADGSQIEMDDYTVQASLRAGGFATGTTLQFSELAGKNETLQIQILPTDDSLVELDEDFEIHLTDPDVAGTSAVVIDGREANLSGSNDIGTGTIFNDDAAEISVADLVSVDEGDVVGDNTQVTFTITMDNPADVDTNIPVTFTDETGSIVSLNDYTAPGSMTVTFTGTNDNTTIGPLTQTFTVSIDEDIQVEEDEILEITLGTPVGTGVAAREISIGAGDISAASVTIDNDDAAKFSIVTLEPLSINEEGIGKNTGSGSKDATTTVDFTIELRDADNDMLTSVDEPVTLDVTFDLSEMTSTNFSGSGADFTPASAFAINGVIVPLGNITFDAGAGTYTMSVTFATNSQTVDVSFTFNDDELVENNAGEDFNVALTALYADIDPSVDVTTPLSIDAAEDDITITVLETDFAIISMTQTLAGDMDGIYDEGADTDTQVVTYQVTIDKDIDRDLSIDWTIAANSAIEVTGAVGDNDFIADNTGTLMGVRTNDATYVFAATIVGDDMLEADEIFDIALVNSDATSLSRDVQFSNGNTPTAGASDDLAITTEIHNDDATELTVNATSNGDENDGAIQLTYELTNPIDIDMDVSIALDAPGMIPATLSADYTYAMTVTFPAGQTTYAVDVVTPMSDVIVERDETVSLTIGGVSLADNNYRDDADADIVTVGTDKNSVVTINNDDETIITITQPAPNNMDEGDGSNTMDFVVNSSLEVDAAFLVTFSVNGINGDSSTDGDGNTYDWDLSFDNNETEAGSLTIMTVQFDALSTASQTVTVTALDDNIVELDEHFKIELTVLDVDVFQDGRLSSFGANSATGVIDNDDDAFFEINDGITAIEGDESLDYTVSIKDGSGAPARVDLTGGASELRVNYTITGGMMDGIMPAQDVNDVNAASITFNVDGDNISSQTASLSILTVDDLVGGLELVEADESVVVTLDSYDALGIAVDMSMSITTTPGDEEGLGTIYNDDDLEFRFTSVMGVTENETALSHGYSIDISNPVSNSVTIDVLFATSDNGMNDDLESDGSDYSLTSAFNGGANNPATITFDALGSLQETYTFTWIADANTVEPDEQFTLGLQDFVAAWVGDIENADPVSINTSFDVVASTITENETATISIASNLSGMSDTLDEPDGTDTDDVVFTISIDKHLENPIDINYVVSDYTANSRAANEKLTPAPVGDDDYDLDYVGTFGTVTSISSSTVTTYTFTITVNGDDVVEADEEFHSVIDFEGVTAADKGYQNVVISGDAGDNNIVTTIANEDNAVIIIEADAVSVNEEDAASMKSVFVVKYDPAQGDVLVDRDMVINFATSNGSGINGVDEDAYVDMSGDVGHDDYFAVDADFTILSGSSTTSTATEVTIKNDDVVELTQQFEVTIVEAGSASFTGRDVEIDVDQDTRTGTIADNDIAEISITEDVSSVVEPDSGTIDYGFTISATREVERGVGYTVAYSLVDDTATDNDGPFDFQNDFDMDTASPVLFSGDFNAGGNTREDQSLNVLINGDLDVELTETFDVQLGLINPNTGIWSGKIILDTGADVATGEVTDTDAATVTISNLTYSELEDSGSITFDITMSAAVDENINVGYAMFELTAESDIDFGLTLPESGDAIYTAGQSGLRQVTVDIVTDDIVEADEYFTFELRNIEDDFGITTTRNVGFDLTEVGAEIIDDDKAYIHLEEDHSVNENAGTITFNVTLDGEVDRAFKVKFLTEDGSDLNGNATSPNEAFTGDNDYDARTGRLDFTGSRDEVKTITVVVTPDFKVEMDEFFFVTLDNNGITDTQTPLPKSITNAASELFGYDIEYRLGTPASPGAAGQSSLRNTATIANDDFAQITLVADAPDADFELTEENTLINYSVDIVAAGSSTTITGIDVPVTVNVQTGVRSATDGTNATSDVDFDSKNSNFTFNIGQLTKTFTVEINEDLVVEQDELFNVVVGSLSASNRALVLEDEDAGATPTVLTKATTITDDDQVYVKIEALDDSNGVITFDDEGNATNSQTFRFTLVNKAGGSTSIDRDLRIDITDALSGWATAGDDYTVPTDPIIVDRLTSFVEIEVDINGELVVERDEDFTLEITGLTVGDWDGSSFTHTYPSYVADGDVEISPSAGSTTFTIMNDEEAVFSITPSNTSDFEGDGTNTLEYLVTSSHEVDAAYTVSFDLDGLSDGSDPIEPSDDVTYSYNGTGDMINFTGVFNNGSVESHTITVTIVDDPVVELDEELAIDLLSVDASVFNGDGRDASNSGSSNRAKGTILNDDEAYVTISDPVAVTEPNSGTTDLVFVVYIDAPVDANVNVQYTVGGEVTLAGNFPDYGTVNPLESSGVTFPLGIVTAGTQTITIPINGDNLVESDEIITVQLGTPSSGGRDVFINADETSLGESVIENDDEAQFTVTGLTTTGEADGSVEYTIILDNPVDRSVDVDVDLTVTELNGNGEDDFNSTTAFNGGGTNPFTLNFATEVTSMSYTFYFKDSEMVEDDEDYIVTLDNVSVNMGTNSVANAVRLNDTPAANTVTTTIEDDDRAYITLNADQSEDESVGTVTLTATLNGAVETGVTVDWDLNDVTTTYNVDYTHAATGTFTFTTGTNSVGYVEAETITITIVDDKVVELDESFTIDLADASVDAGGRNVHTGSAGTNANDADVSSTVTIENNDAVTVNVTAAASAPEDASDTQDFTVTLLDGGDNSTTVDVDFDVTYVIANNTTEDEDWDPNSGNTGTVTFTVGSLTQTFSIDILDDLIVELDETVDATITLGDVFSHSVTAGIVNATYTIDDDDSGTIVIDDILTSQDEDFGSYSHTISFLEPGVTTDINLGFVITRQDLNLFDVDDENTVNNPVLSAGNTNTLFTVTPEADVIVEQDENYEYELTSLDIATSIALGSRAITISSTEDVGSMTITNDDTTTLSIDVDGTDTVFESNTITFIVTSSNPVDASFTASFTTSAGSTVIAAEAGDYSANGGVLTLNFNGDDDEEQTIDVFAIDDDIVEVDETFTLTLVDPQGMNAFVGGRLVAIDGSFGSADGTIEDTDFATITINDITPFSEGDVGAQTITFTVTKDYVIEGDALDVNFSIDESGDSDTDLGSSIPVGMVNFPGDGSQNATATIEISVLGDELVEFDEDVVITLTGHSFDGTYSRVTIPNDGTEQGTTTINNDETATIAVVQVSASSVTENDDTETNTISFEITSTHDIAPEVAVQVDYATSNGSALIEEGATVGDNDYDALNDTQSNIVSKTGGSYVIPVTINGDNIVETDENFNFTISGLSTSAPADVVMGTLTQTGTIFNDDQTQVRISSTGTVAETNGDITSTFTLTLDDKGANNARAIDEDLYVFISGSDFNFGLGYLATQDVDYDIESNSIVTLAAGDMTKTFTITIIGDAVVEKDEFLELTIDDIEVANPEITSYTDDTDVIINTVDNNDVAGLTITNDDETTFSLTNAAGPTTSENYPKRDESGTFTYTVTTSNAIESYNGETFTIGYTILNGGAAQIKYRDTEDVEDFATAMTGTIIFTANPGVNAFVTQDVTLVDETLVELDEDFRFRIDEIDAQLNENGRMAQFTSDDSFREFIGIIEDSDVAYVSVIVQGDSDKFETDLGEDDELVFDVTLSAPVDDQVSVTFSSLDGFIAEPGEDATTGDGDYTSNTGTATFDARTTASQTITIPIIGDYKVEDDEKVGVLIENLKVDNVLVDVTSLWVEEVSIMTATTEGTILNDDAAVVVIRDAGDDGLGSNGFEGDTDTSAGKSVFKVFLYDATDLAGSVYTPVSVDRALTIQYITVDGTNAVDGNGLDLGAGSNIGVKNDFVSTNGTLTFPAELNTPQTVNVNYVKDDTPENDEVFSAELQTVTLAITGGDTRAVTVGTGTNRIGTGYVLNDDRPKFRVDVPTSAPVGNGLENTRDVTFRVYLDGPIIGANTVTIDYVVSAGTATESVDYDGNASPLTGTLSFNAGDTDQDITINVLDDAIGEGNEDLSIAISNPLASNKAELNDDPAELTATATIIDDDVINVSVATSAAVVDESAGTVTFTLAIDKDITGGDVSFTYDILGALSSGNTATVTNDFTVGAVTDVITFADGSMAGDSQTVVVSIVDDAVVEGDEYISMQLSDLTTTIPGVVVPTGLNFSNTEIETKITDNDAAQIYIADFTINESTSVANVVVTTTALIDRDVAVQLTTSEINATEAEDAGVDFATTNVSVVIPANMSTGSHTIVINNDDLVEGDEDFNIAIGVPSGAGTDDNASVSAGTNTAIVTIDDDDVSTVSIVATASVSEEVAGGIINVPVTLSKAVDVDMNITVNTMDVSTDGDDFTAQSNTVYPIAAGTTSINIPVTITNTNLVELSETFTVTISNLDVPSGIMDKDVSIGTAATSTVTITDTDQAIITIDPIADTEENLGAMSQTVTITMSNPVDTDVLFSMSTVEGTAKSTDVGGTEVVEGDFNLISGQAITIDANGGLAPNTTVYVVVIDDNLVETDESFGLQLSGLSAGGRNVIFSSSAATVDATVSIDETDKSTISIANVTQSESLGTMNFDIVITNPIDQPVSLTVNTRVVTATPGSDYTAISDATYTIPAGTLSASLTDLPVTITTDNLVEATESFTLELSGLTVAAGRDVTLTGLGATLNATGTILDNDEAQITFAASNTPTGTEGVGQLITFKIAMSNPVDQTVTFDYTTDFNANATAGFDAENKSNQLTFGAANNADKTVTVNLVNNEIVEGDEYFDLLLSNLAIPTGRNVYFYDVDAMTTTTEISSTATISDDDVATISIADKSVTEDVDANAVLTLTSDKQIDKAIAIDVALSDVSANTGTDYDATGISSANLNALSLTTTLSVPILGGDIVEGTETFDVTISDEANSLTLDGYNIFIAAATDNVGVVTISDNDETTLAVADNSISEDGGSMIITVSTVKAFDTDVTMAIDFADVSTIADDFTHTSGTIQITEGAFSGTITVAINDDDIVDGTEEFTGTISAFDVTVPVGADDYQAAIDDALGEFTIYDAGDHADFSVTVDAPGSFTEGNNATFTVVNDGDLVDEDVTVSFTYTDGTAEDGSDYTAVADVVITKLTTSNTLTVPTIETSGQPNGVLTEDTEDFMLAITSLDVTNVAAHSVSIGGVNAATATITDNDAAEITLSDITVDEDAGTATVKINTSNELDNDVTIDLTYVEGGLAVNGVDYTSGPASVTILAGNLSADIVVTILDNNTIVEGDETFSINANTITVANSGDNDVSITDAEAIVTITDADATTVSIVGATVAEDDGTMTIEVQTDNGYTFDKDVSVQVNFADISTISGVDYDASGVTSLSILEGQSTGAMTITINTDNLVDGTEQFTATISDLSVGASAASSPNNTYDASINVATETMTITDIDQAMFSIADITVSEGDGTAEVTLTNDTPVDEPVSVTFTFTDGTATSGNDYTVVTLPVTVTAGSMTNTLSIPILDMIGNLGQVVEGTEMFTVDIDQITVSPVDAADLADHVLAENDGTAEVTINDNDATTISLVSSVDNTTEEGDVMTFTIESVLEFDKNVTVLINTTDNTALAGSTNDYTALAGTTITIPAGTKEGVKTTATIENTIVEGTEDFSASISGLSVGSGDGYDAAINVAAATATYTITDDDATTISIVSTTLSEDGGNMNIGIVSDSGLKFDKDVTVTVALTPGSATAADYGTLSSTTIVLPATSTTGFVTLPIVDDMIVDGDEAFTAKISNLSVGTGDGYDASISSTDMAQFTIYDNDEAILTVSANQSVNEGNVTADNSVIEFTVTLDNMVDEELTLDYSTIAGTALASSDFINVTAGTLTFDALTANNSQTVSIQLVEDKTVEANESFSVEIGGLEVPDNTYEVSLQNGGAVVSSVTRVGTITNDDQAIISIADVSVEEATGIVTIEITMDNPVDEPVTITGNTRQSTAKNTVDYVQIAGSAYTFDTGERFTNSTITIEIKDDNLVEATEEFELELSDIIAGGKNVVFSSGGATVSGVVTITDLDAATVSITDETLSEDGGSMVFTVGLSDPVDETLIVTANTAGGTAITAQDFTGIVNQQIVFGAGSNTDKTVTVPIVNNSIVEATETFELILSNITVAAGRNVTFVSGASSTTETGIGTITDEDEASVSINDVTMNEGDAGTVTYTFDVTLNGAVDQAVTLDYTTSDGTATVDNSDYVATNGSLNFSGAIGQVLTVDVITNGDLIVEEDEMFNVILSNLNAGGKNVSISKITGIGTLTNTDSRPVVTPGIVINVSEDAEVTTMLSPVITASDLKGTPVWSIVSITAVNSTGNTVTTGLDGVFTIGSGDGIISVGQALDRETIASYTVSVQVTDGLNTSAVETVAITVTDVNDNAPVVDALTFTLSDDAAIGYSLGSITATDADLNPSFTSWLITGGNVDEVFTLNSLTGELTVADNSNLDFDITAAYNLTITVSDGKFVSAPETIKITIIDTNDAPTAIALTDSDDEDSDNSNVDIFESVNVGTLVGFFTTTDVDAGDSHTYSLVGGVGSEQNGLFTITNNELSTGQLLDFEETPVASIRVRTTDSKGEFFDQVFTIVLIQDVTLELIYANTITPGGDGKNDKWIIENISAHPEAEVTITNTDKSIIFSSVGYAVPFDGTFNGRPLPTGSYPFTIKLSTGEEKGTLNILRLKN